MNPDLAIVLGLLALAIAMFAINKPRIDAVGLIMLTAWPVSAIRISFSWAHCSCLVKVWCVQASPSGSETG